MEKVIIALVNRLLDSNETLEQVASGITPKDEVARLYIAKVKYTCELNKEVLKSIETAGLWKK